MLEVLFHFARNGISTFPCHLILFDAILRRPIRSIDFKPLVFINEHYSVHCPLQALVSSQAAGKKKRGGGGGGDEEETGQQSSILFHFEVEEGHPWKLRKEGMREWERNEREMKEMEGGREWRCWWSLVLQLAADRFTNSTKLAWCSMFHDRLCQSAAENLRLYDTTVSQPILIHCSRHLPSDLLPLFHSFFHSNIF